MDIGREEIFIYDPIPLADHSPSSLYPIGTWEVIGRQKVGVVKFMAAHSQSNGENLIFTHDLSHHIAVSFRSLRELDLRGKDSHHFVGSVPPRNVPT
jgi:hypothetical protein